MTLGCYVGFGRCELSLTTCSMRFCASNCSRRIGCSTTLWPLLLCCACVLAVSRVLLQQNPMLPLAWWKPGVQPADQPPNSLKPHQLEGLRFMWNCLVVEHAAADAAAAGGSGGGRQKKQRRSKDVLGAASDSDDEDSDLIDDPPRQEPVYVDDAGGCILAHSMGEQSGWHICCFELWAPPNFMLTNTSRTPVCLSLSYCDLQVLARAFRLWPCCGCSSRSSE